MKICCILLGSRPPKDSRIHLLCLVISLCQRLSFLCLLATTMFNMSYVLGDRRSQTNITFLQKPFFVYFIRNSSNWRKLKKNFVTILFGFFFFQDNLVGTVVVISLLIWIPASCLISWIDRQRAERDQKEWEWRRQDELIHPEDKRRIIHIRVPRRTVSMAASNCN